MLMEPGWPLSSSGCVHVAPHAAGGGLCVVHAELVRASRTDQAVVHGDTLGSGDLQPWLTHDWCEAKCCCAHNSAILVVSSQMGVPIWFQKHSST